MGALVGSIIGAILASFGFLVMRNPMRLAVLGAFDPTTRGYYQRMVLDTFMRNQMRIMGALACTLGLVVGTAASGALIKSRVLQSVSDGLLLLLWFVFGSAWVVGLIHLVIDLVRGRGLGGWFQMWRASAEMGEIDVSPFPTPKMQREAIFFTIAFCVLLCITLTLTLMWRQ